MQRTVRIYTCDKCIQDGAKEPATIEISLEPAVKSVLNYIYFDDKCAEEAEKEGWQITRNTAICDCCHSEALAGEE